MLANPLLKRLMLAILIMPVLLAACQPAAPAVPTPDPEALITEAAATVAVQLTQFALLTPSPAPTNTPAPTSTPPPPPTATANQPAPPPAAATNTPPPAGNPGSSADNASFVDDVTVPDGTAIAPGAVFDKVWRIKNTGQTTWTTGYTLVFIDGERMGSPDSIAMPREVKPGETIDISVRLTAPVKTGTFQTFYRLRTSGGQFFRLDGTGDLWVKIMVGSSPTSTPTGEAVEPTPTPTS
jgi:hypothetical protein